MQKKSVISRQKSEASTCATCGYRWTTGTDGSHSCAEWLAKRVARLERDWQLENRIIELLVVGGFVTRERVEQARTLLTPEARER